MQESLDEEDKEAIMKIIKKHNIDCDAQECCVADDGTKDVYHREVSIHISDYDDESEEFEMYFQVD